MPSTRSTQCCAKQALHAKYPIWYVPALPLDWINVSQKVPREGREEWRIALAENIRENGLINPLIVLNHRPVKEYQPQWLMTGTNRLWALQYLGWTTAPAIVTGACPFDKVEVPPSELQSYFPDGEVYFGTHGPRLAKVARPEFYEYPRQPSSPASSPEVG